MPSLPPMVSDGQIILPSWGNAVRSVLLSGLGRITRRGQIIVGAAPLETIVLDPPLVADSPGVLHMTAAGEASYLPLADIKPGPDSITAVELAPGSVGPVELQDDAVTRPALADAAVGTAEVGGGAITAPKLSAGVRESLANVEPYARPTMPAALIPITRIDTRSIYLAGEGTLPTAAGTSDGDILIRINAQRAGIGLVPRLAGDWTFDPPDSLFDAVGLGDTVYGVSSGRLKSFSEAAELSSATVSSHGVTALDSSTLVTHTWTGGPFVLQKRTLAGAAIDASFNLGGGNGTASEGIAYTGGHYYILIRNYGLRAWNATTRARVNARNIPISSEPRLKAVTVADGHFYVARTNGDVEVWTTDGVRVTSRDFSAQTGLNAIAAQSGHLVAISNDAGQAYNYDGSRLVHDDTYVDRVTAALYQSDGSAWAEVSSVAGIHGGGGPSTGITAAQAEAIATVAARALFTDALQIKLQDIEADATRDQVGSELVTAITAEIGTAWRAAGVSLATVATAIEAHDVDPLGSAHVALVAGHNSDAGAHPGVVGHRGAAIYSGVIFYDAVANRLSGTHVGQDGRVLPRDVFYGLAPGSLGGVASINGLSMTVDGNTWPLTDVDAVPIAPRQLQKARLFVFLLGATEWRLIEPLVFPSPVSDYPRYGLFTGDNEALPTAAQFLGGQVWMAQQSYGTAIVRTEDEYHWIADRRDDLAIIATGSPSLLPNALANTRHYRLDPVSILIGGVQYWAYRSKRKLRTGFINYDYQVVLRPG